MQPKFYFFILGSQPSLSQAEILSFFSGKLFLKSEEVVLLPALEFIDASEAIRKLGGVVKIGLIIKNLEILKDGKNIKESRLLKYRDNKVDAQSTQQKENEEKKYAIKQSAKLQISKKLSAVLADLICQELSGSIKGNKKIYFGLSLYSLDNIHWANCGKRMPSAIYKPADLKQIAIDVKNNLKIKKVKCRWVNSRDFNLSSVIVKTNRLLSSSGIEIVLIEQKNKIFIGKTQAVQEFAELEKRDYGRPRIDTKSGMLPPKLAKIMINLGLARGQKLFFHNKKQINGNRQAITILDPFCGSGTILSEILTMFQDTSLNTNINLLKIIGADISQTAVKNTKENLEWLIKTIYSKYSFLPKMNIFQADVRNLSKRVQQHSVDLIITEPYLGPPLKGNESREQIFKIQNELKILYLNAFREFKKILHENKTYLKDKSWKIYSQSANNACQQNITSAILDCNQEQLSSIVIIFPIFKTQTGNRYLDILIDLEKMGFKMQKFPGINVNNRGGLTYGRPSQRLWREIFVFNY